MSLPVAPAHVVVSGQPASGRYGGRIDRIDWRDLAAARQRSALWRRLHHKRWQYVGIGSAELFIGVALVDVGWCVSSFAYLFDRTRRRLLVDWSQDGLPGLSGGVADAPVTGAHAWFKGWRAALSLQHGAGDVLTLDVDVPGLRVAARLQLHDALQDAAPLLLAVGPIEGGAAHATQKSSALRTAGWAEAGGRRFELGEALSCLDSSNGLLAHRTAWRWACAHGREVGFNLQQGYFGNFENALWLDGELIGLGGARFEFDPRQPLQAWRVHTDDDLLDLRFTPEGARQADRNLGFAASHYVQPVGTFDGWVRATASDARRPVRGLLGVTEDHRSKW